MTKTAAISLLSAGFCATKRSGPRGAGNTSTALTDNADNGGPRNG